jgi:L-ascorbate metabolism protein UlaG (beta-lactamase superfamily)
MKVTKLEHACLDIVVDDGRLIVDPGGFTLPLLDASGITAVVVTHQHPDHWSKEHLDHIRRQSPDAKFFGPLGVVGAADGFAFTEVKDGDEIEIGPFSLRFFGEKHAVIHESIPVIDNVGVLVNGSLFYPGDAFTVPPVPVHTLAAPAGAPWLKVAEAMDYILTVAPKRAFPTHEMVLARVGQNMVNDRLRWATEQGGGEYRVLEPTESIDL